MSINLKSMAEVADLESWRIKFDRIAKEKNSDLPPPPAQTVSSVLDAKLLDEVAELIARCLPRENGMSKEELMARIRSKLGASVREYTLRNFLHSNATGNSD